MAPSLRAIMSPAPSGVSKYVPTENVITIGSGRILLTVKLTVSDPNSEALTSI